MVLAQDQGQRNQSLVYENKKKADKEAQEEFEKATAAYNIEKAKIDAENAAKDKQYEIDLAKWEADTAEYERQLNAFNLEQERIAAKEKSDREEAERIRIAEAETAAKIVSDRKAIETKYNDNIADLTKQADIAVSKIDPYHTVADGKGGFVRKQKLRAVLKDNELDIRRQFGYQITYQQEQMRQEINLYDYKVQFGNRPLRQSEIRAFEGGDRSLVSIVQSRDAARRVTAERNKQSSIQTARNNIIVSAQQYASNPATFAASITNFGGTELREFSKQELERRAEIKPLRPNDIPTIAKPRLKKATVKVNRVGVDTGQNIRKPEHLQDKQIASIDTFLDQYKSTERPPAAVLTGVVQRDTGKPPTPGTQKVISDLSAIPKYTVVERSGVITDPKSGQRFDTKTGIGSLKIAAGLGYSESQNVPEPTINSSYTLIGSPTAAPRKPIGALGRGLEIVTKKLDELQQVKFDASKPETYLLDVGKQGVGLAKAGLTTISGIINIGTQKVETINLRGTPSNEIKYDNAYSFLGSAAVNVGSRVQFDEPTKGEIRIQDNLFDRVISSGSIENVPAGIASYASKYGIRSTIGETGEFLIGGAGGRVVKGGGNLLEKVGVRIGKEDRAVPAAGKIYPNINKQKQLTPEQVNRVRVIVTEIKAGKFTVTPIFIGKKAITPARSKLETILPKDIRRSPTPNYWQSERVSPKVKGGKPPVKTTPVIGSTYRPVPRRASRDLIDSKYGKPFPVIDLPKGVDVPKVVSTNAPPRPINYSAERPTLVKAKSGAPPIQRGIQKISYAPVPRRASSDLIPRKNQGTLRDPVIDLPKGVDVPKVVSTNAPPRPINYSAERPFKGKLKGASSQPIKTISITGSKHRPIPGGKLDRKKSRAGKKTKIIPDKVTSFKGSRIDTSGGRIGKSGQSTIQITKTIQKSKTKQSAKLLTKNEASLKTKEVLADKKTSKDKLSITGATGTKKKKKTNEIQEYEIITVGKGKIPKSDLKLDLSISPKTAGRIDTTQTGIIGTSSRISTKQNIGHISKTEERLRERSVVRTRQPQKQRSKLRSRMPEKSPIKPGQTLRSKQPQAPKIKQKIAQRNPKAPKTKQRVGIVPGRNDTKKRKIRKVKSKKLKEFVGNSSDVQFEGIYKRGTISRKKSTIKKSRKDNEKLIKLQGKKLSGLKVTKRVKIL